MRSAFFMYLSEYAGAMPRRVEPNLLSPSLSSSSSSRSLWYGMDMAARS